MALIQMNIMSECLMRTVPVRVILPADKVLYREGRGEEKPFPTLYLLHGLLGSDEDWVNNTCIKRLAEDKDLAVVMQKLGYDLTYEEGPGAHEWDFWNRSIERVLNWLPLKKETAGLSSGNIGGS